MSDDPVLELEKLSALHRGGELTDAEFEQAKRQLLNRGAGDGSGGPMRSAAALTVPAPSTFADPAPSGRPVRWREDSRSESGGIWLAGSWKLTLIVMLAVGAAFGIAALILAEVAPSTAQWTKGVICSGGEQLVTNGGVVHSNGGSAQGATHFYCVPAGPPPQGLDLISRPEQTGGVLGLSFLVGFLIGDALAFTTVALLSLRSRARRSSG